jgi:hypothetical protein
MTSFHWLRQSKKVEYHAKRETGKFCGWAVRYMSEQSWNTPQEGCCNLWCIVKMSCKSPPAIAATSTNQKRKCTPTRPNRDLVRQKEYHLRLPCQSSCIFHLDSSFKLEQGHLRKGENYRHDFSPQMQRTTHPSKAFLLIQSLRWSKCNMFNTPSSTLISRKGVCFQPAENPGWQRFW